MHREKLTISKLMMSLVALPFFMALGVVGAQNDRLIIGSGAEISSLDPRIATDVPSFERINVMMEPLVVYNTDLSLEPRLATEWSFSEDGLAITFNLRDDVTFHHGRDFTSEDVSYTFEWVLDEENAARNRPLYTDITSIETPDPYTVVFNLSEPNAFLLNNIARMPIVPADLGDDQDFASNPVGTGPYQLESLRRDDRLVMNAFDGYWGGRATIDTIEFRPIPEDGTRLLAFEAGEIDMSQAQPVPTELPRLEEDASFNVQRTPGTGYTYLGMNTQVPPLDDVRVRQAISYLVPREALVERILNGIGQPGISMLSPETPWFNPEVMRFEYDPERARALLAEAGYEDGFELRLHTSEDPVRMQVAEIMQAELSQVGVTLSVTIEEFGAFLDRVQTTDDFDLFILSWVGQLDPDRAIMRQFTTDGSANYANYTNERVDELAVSGRSVAPDSEASIEIYREAQALIVEEAPFAFVNYTEEIGLHHPYIEGWTVHPYSAATYQNAHLIQKNR